MNSAGRDEFPPAVARAVDASLDLLRGKISPRDYVVIFDDLVSNDVTGETSAEPYGEVFDQTHLWVALYTEDAAAQARSDLIGEEELRAYVEDFLKNLSEDWRA